MYAWLKTLSVGLVTVIVVATPIIYQMPRAEACGFQPFLGEICIFAFTFCPQGFARTEGQLLLISQNQALFSLLGTTYGGDGITTFGLPDLRGRTARGTGQGAGLANVDLGEMAGAETVTLSIAELPAHSHALQATSTPGNHPGPNGKILARANPDTLVNLYNTAPPDVTMAASSISATGGRAARRHPVPVPGPHPLHRRAGHFPHTAVSVASATPPGSAQSPRPCAPEHGACEDPDVMRRGRQWPTR